MKIRAFVSLIAAGSIALSGTVFGGTMDITGKVIAVTKNMITVQSENGLWNVTRADDVRVTGDLKVGGTVTIHCSETDAQKKEGPTVE
jgi:RNase P/RNase MRP subunit p29